MNTIEAKRIRIVDYLRLLGHEPVKVRGGQYWYLSPLRKEDTPSSVSYTHLTLPTNSLV